VTDRPTDCKKWKTEQFWDEESQEHRLETVPDLPALPSGGRDYRSRKNSRVHIPSYRDFREHYIYKLSFWACCIQTVSSCLFLWGGICAVPQIYNVISTSRILLNTLYWLPKLLACIGFISAGVLNTLERQNEWSKPAWNALGVYHGPLTFRSRLLTSDRMAYWDMESHRCGRVPPDGMLRIWDVELDEIPVSALGTVGLVGFSPRQSLVLVQECGQISGQDFEAG
jgi:hypothetical protein